MLRSDVRMYATSIDIHRLDNFRLDDDNNKNTGARAKARASALFDRENRYAVIPAFAKHPVNDRMINEPYAAVKIWESERFAKSILKEMPGYGMHSEKLLISPRFEKPVLRFTSTRTCAFSDSALTSRCGSLTATLKERQGLSALSRGMANWPPMRQRDSSQSPCASTGLQVSSIKVTSHPCVYV
jgi:hypothetical protein